MQKIIFTAENLGDANLYPFSLTRHIQDIKLGILSIREKWERILNQSSLNKFQNNYLDNADSIKLDNNIEKGNYLLLNGNVLPDKSLIFQIKKLKNGEVLFSKNGKKIAHKFSENDIMGLNKIKINQEIKLETEVQILEYPWQIFQWNDKAIRADFQLVTSKRKTAKISKTNVLMNPAQVFIEKGAEVEHCVLNASSGPIYIGKDALLMEGTMIRGPFSAGEKAVIKMGTKIYGATTVGAFCTVGGEIKNSVIMNYSNKAHDGYLGDSVLGEWCNLGAGTSNSNIKNNCAEINYLLEGKASKESVGNKGGLLMGDYSKAAINTSFNTGSVVGVCSNVFTNGLTPKYIQNFSWGGKDNTSYKLKNALADIDKWKQLKGLKITERETEILTHICKNFK